MQSIEILSAELHEAKTLKPTINKLKQHILTYNKMTEITHTHMHTWPWATDN